MTSLLYDETFLVIRLCLLFFPRFFRCMNFSPSAHFPSFGGPNRSASSPLSQGNVRAFSPPLNPGRRRQVKRKATSSFAHPLLLGKRHPLRGQLALFPGRPLSHESGGWSQQLTPPNFFRFQYQPFLPDFPPFRGVLTSSLRQREPSTPKLFFSPFVSVSLSFFLCL